MLSAFARHQFVVPPNFGLKREPALCAFGGAQVQVKSMMMWSSRNKAGNILRSAASSGSRDTFGAVLASLELELPPAEVNPRGSSGLVCKLAFS